MSLLPYGLRTTMSASTWASPTVRDLKLRLFFTNAGRDDGGRTSYATWGQPTTLDPLVAGGDAPSIYLGRLRQVGSRAAAELASQTAPVRFDPDEIRKMVANLPEGGPIEGSLKKLANSLRDRDAPAVTLVVKRLQRYLAHDPEPAERQAYWQQIARLGLLKDHPGIYQATSVSLYRVLLRLAFNSPFSYVDYCEIEDAIGGPPPGTLRSALLELRIDGFLPWLLVATAETTFDDKDLRKRLADRGTSASTLLSQFQQCLEEMRSEHRAVICDFAVRYLSAYAENPRAELVRRGFLAETLETVFPGNQLAQRRRLEQILRFVYGGMLTREQIRDLFAEPQLNPTPALLAAVMSLMPSPRAGRFIQEQAALARNRHAALADVREVQRGAQRHSRVERTGAWGILTRRLRNIAQFGVPLVLFIAGVIFLIIFLLDLLKNSR